MGKYDPAEKRHLASLTKKVVPSFILAKYPRFVSVVEAFLENLDREDHTELDLEKRFGAYSLLRRIHKLIDVDETEEEFLSKFAYHYLGTVSPDVVSTMDTRLFVRKSREFMEAKGKKSAFEFLFRIIGSKIEVKQPQRAILKLSEAGNLLSGTRKYTGPFVAEGYVEPGYFEDPDPDLGKDYVDKKIRDNYYYAEYVYAVETDLDPSQTRSLIGNLLHPLGTSLFVDYKIFLDVAGADYSAKAAEFVELTDGAVADRDVSVDPSFTSVFMFPISDVRPTAANSGSVIEHDSVLSLPLPGVALEGSTTGLTATAADLGSGAVRFDFSSSGYVDALCSWSGPPLSRASVTTRIDGSRNGVGLAYYAQNYNNHYRIIVRLSGDKYYAALVRYEQGSVRTLVESSVPASQYADGARLTATVSGGLFVVRLSAVSTGGVTEKLMFQYFDANVPVEYEQRTGVVFRSESEANASVTVETSAS